jgi:hypothetical protein
MNPSSNSQPKIAEMYPGIYQPANHAEGDGGPDLPIQPLNTLLGFDLETYQVPLDHLLPSKKIMDGTRSSRPSTKSGSSSPCPSSNPTPKSQNSFCWMATCGCSPSKSWAWKPRHVC